MDSTLESCRTLQPLLDLEGCLSPQYLLHNLGSAEVAPQAHAPGEAELAVLRAADLRGDAQRRPLRPAGDGPLHRDDHCLYCARCTIPLHMAFHSHCAHLGGSGAYISLSKYRVYPGTPAAQGMHTNTYVLSL